MPPSVLFAADAQAWPEVDPVALARHIPGLATAEGPFVTWVHPYTFQEAAKMRDLALAMSRTKQLSGDTLSIAQVVFVCRQERGSAARSFRLEVGQERQAYELLIQRLPARLVEAICAESDALSLQGYVPPTTSKTRGTPEELQTLQLQLAEPGMWADLDSLCLRVYGVSLRQNGEPLGEVLTALLHDEAQQEQLLAGLRPLAALAAALGGGA